MSDALSFLGRILFSHTRDFQSSYKLSWNPLFYFHNIRITKYAFKNSNTPSPLSHAYSIPTSSYLIDLPLLPALPLEHGLHECRGSVHCLAQGRCSSQICVWLLNEEDWSQVHWCLELGLLKVLEPFKRITTPSHPYHTCGSETSQGHYWPGELFHKGWALQLSRCMDKNSFAES